MTVWETHQCYVFVIYQLCSVLVSLLAIWMFFGKQQWLWRSATLSVVMASFLLLQMQEPLLFWMAQLMLLIGILYVIRLLHGKKQEELDHSENQRSRSKKTFQWKPISLKFLGWGVLLGVCFWMLDGIVPKDYRWLEQAWPLLLSQVGITAVMGWVFLLSDWQTIRKGLLGILLIGLCVAFFMVNGSAAVLSDDLMIPSAWWHWGLITQAATLWIWLSLWKASCSPKYMAQRLFLREAEIADEDEITQESGPSMAFVFQVCLFLLTFCFVLPFMLIAFIMIIPTSLRSDPEGEQRYQNLMAINQQLKPPAFGSEKPTREELKAYSDQHANELKEIRALLEQPIAVPLINRKHDRFESSDFFATCTLLRAQADWAYESKHYADALDGYLWLLVLGNRITYNGTWWDEIHGLQIKIIALNRMDRLLPHLTPSRGELALRLFEGEVIYRQTWGEIEDREIDFLYQNCGWRGRFHYAMSQFSGLWEQLSAELQNQRNTVLTAQEFLRTHFALKSYQMRVGEYPADLTLLVPTWLNSLPLNLENGDRLTYELSVEGYELRTGYTHDSPTFALDEDPEKSVRKHFLDFSLHRFPFTCNCAP